ncbi:MAG: methyltransferase domain-containing protein [Bacteroidales bacterium]|jgi:ubiquinone/menaquinone biosynthesis C-methylase UbiE|nr:methyltransferase domain-containing protein [Bacteroidales bacterium]
MNTDRFFELFFKELEDNKNLYPYYKLTEGNLKHQAFRKAYFQQRLRFIDENIDKTKDNKIFDCGCGYGTTAIFLAMQGVSTYGVTLEFYYKELENRRKYWKEYGDTSLFECKYDDLFDLQLLDNSFDYIILQDTLHHLEPLKNSLELFYRILKPKGKIILVEENGNCLPQVFKLYLQRGNKRVIDYYDEVLGKSLQMGNENIRSQKAWKKLFEASGFSAKDDKTEYIRLFPPFLYNSSNSSKLIQRESRIAKSCPIIKEYVFFGLNMIFEKN